MKDYEVTINFGGFLIGYSEIYSVSAESEEEAREEALQMAINNLYVECVEEIE